MLKKDAILDSKVLAEPAVGELVMTQYVMTSCGSAPKMGACKEEGGGCVVLGQRALSCSGRIPISQVKEVISAWESEKRTLPWDAFKP